MWSKCVIISMMYILTSCTYLMCTLYTYIYVAGIYKEKLRYALFDMVLQTMWMFDTIITICTYRFMVFPIYCGGVACNDNE